MDLSRAMPAVAERSSRNAALWSFRPVGPFDSGALGVNDPAAESTIAQGGGYDPFSINVRPGAVNSYLIEYRTSAPFERPEQWCECVLLEVHEAIDGGCARLWVRRYQGADWAQSPSLESSEVRKSPAMDLPLGEAERVLTMLRETRVGVVPPVGLGIHPATHSLRIQSFSSECHLVWLDVLPPQWSSLESVVQHLKRLGTESDERERSPSA